MRTVLPIRRQFPTWKHEQINIRTSSLKNDRHLAEDIIIDLLKRDMEVGGRIRLLCVYTAQTHPENILGDLGKRIFDELDLSVSGEKKDLAYTIDEKVRIVIFNKSATNVLYGNSKVVSFEELPEALLREFSVLVNGLIPCAALHSISALRERTYSILALMNKNLDGAFCAHRALIPDVDDSIEFILNLISQEISTKILCDESARNFLDTDSIRSWYDGQASPENQYALEKEALWEYLKNGGADLSDVRKQRAKAWLRKKEKSQNQLKDKDGKDISYSEAKAFIENDSFLEIRGCSPPSGKNPDKFAELFYEKQAETKPACNELSRLTCSSKDESDLRKKVFAFLRESLAGGEPKNAFDLMNFWLYLASEKHEELTYDKTMHKLNDIGQYLAERASYHQEWFTSIVPIEDHDIPEDVIGTLSKEFYQGVDARYEHVLAELDVVPR